MRYIQSEVLITSVINYFDILIRSINLFQKKTKKSAFEHFKHSMPFK